MKKALFSEKELEVGKTIVLQKNVRSIDFSRGTYQVEVVQDDLVYWPFLQINESGEIEDCFCSCEQERCCAHLAAAYLAIFHRKTKPLHVRFEESFWNKLCRMASREHGYRTDTLAAKEEGWEAISLSGELFFSIQFKNKSGEKKLREIIENRRVETEESSLKFSRLSEEELLLWRQSNPPVFLRYELSFWSDLAKWFFALQEEEKEYEVTYFPENSLPQWIYIRFACVECKFYVNALAWQDLIFSLSTIVSSLRVFLSKESSLRSVRYDPEKVCFLLEWEPEKVMNKKLFSVNEKEDLGDWYFIPKKGFYKKHEEMGQRPCLIKRGECEAFLQENSSFLRKHLSQKIAKAMVIPQYYIEVDSDYNLRIEMFCWKRKDLLEPMTVLFGRWAYMPKHGFVYLQTPVFSQIVTVIAFDQVCDFIKQHKAWLGGIEGFQVHQMPIEPKVSYQVTQEGDLLFSSRVEIGESALQTVDFGEWVWIFQKGFFPKEKEGIISLIRSGFRVKKKEVSSFLRSYQEDLAWIYGFFSEESPVKEVSFSVFLKDEEIHVVPKFESLKDKAFIFFDEYVYVEGEGFSCMNCVPKDVLAYLGGKVIRKKQQAQFFQELKNLKPWIGYLDPCLQFPKQLGLNLQDLVVESGFLHMNLGYESELGFVDLHTVWQAVTLGQKFLFSKAGRLDLSQDRFQNLKRIAKDRWKEGGAVVELSALEWIFLQTQEKIIPSKKESVQKALREFESCQGFLPLSLDLLKSTLRGYQETGIKWLWFLYCYKLSGILCDEMGLGKTHQAMALLAAASHSQNALQRFLIVCPTSVLYHWQELLKRFLPDLKVYVFYGQSRDVAQLQGDYKILLTSYGLLRSERKELEKVAFDIGIYDEIQQAKNASSQIHKALKLMQVSVKIGLTGTPIENRILELKSLFDIVLPHYLGTDAYFHEQFVLPIEKERDGEKKQLLSKIVHPFVLRRKKVEVLLELPEKAEEIAYCDLSVEQKKLYQDFVFKHSMRCRKDLEKNDVQAARMHIFALFAKLKQVCDHPCLVMEEEQNYFHYESGKWNLFIELLQEARESGQKVVVFTQYLRMMDIIKSYLIQNQIGFTEIRGSTRDRGQALKKFQQDPDCEVFIASLQAAGVGIELTSASVVIHYDRWWNPAKEDQATDRVHRIGQSRGVQVFKLVTKHTVEERIHELICKKKDLLNELIAFDDQSLVKQFSQQDIIALLSSIEQDCAEFNSRF